MIRDARETDLAEILAIYNDAILHTTAIYAYQPLSLEERREWFQKKQADGYPVLVDEIEGEVAGFASFGPFRAWPAYKYTIEHLVYVRHDQRGRGVGAGLLREIIRIANQREYATLVAGIDAANLASIHLHQKLGFTCSGVIKKAGFKFGNWLDLAFYQLELAGPARPTDG
ncbi:phosphinothricin acetyltransferase [Hydrogenispora ethanolica]|jgi:phosphinothricin acetyltransferase|uniref:Phosphinothricin acetyltransferase n=1 Tax=Hydrogenispora ethanolica TaxID=1082276 RepID=A0A4R1SCR5_HYDET|nr:GNAT family N-acetyltransferase [Hydrogenispora ethanolica]TCL76392.1 phosphinothricin acetyltransferase [Hydrogenispora ethanolica]